MTYARTTAALLTAAALVLPLSAQAESHMSETTAATNLRAQQDAQIDASDAEFYACLEGRVDVSAGENLRTEQTSMVSLEAAAECGCHYRSRLLGEATVGVNMREQQNTIDEVGDDE